MEVIQLPSTERIIRVRFAGIIYRRYPLANQSSDRNYFRAGRSDVYKGWSYLHRDIWAAIHGPIPDGHDVDHIDGNPINNAIGNLQLLTEAEHHAKHAPEQSKRGCERWAHMSDEQRAALLAAAAKWHGTAEGLAWHAENGKRVAAGMETVDCICEQCRAAYSVRKIHSTSTRFCSNNCRSAARRASGVDDEERTCKCGTAFVVNRYSKIRNCSLKCARGPAASRPCEHCGTIFSSPPSVGRRYCGLSCAYAARTSPSCAGVQSDRGRPA